MLLNPDPAVYYEAEKGYSSKSQVFNFTLTFISHFTIQLKFLKTIMHVGQKWVSCGSHPHWFVGQWVNRCDPLSTLMYMQVSACSTSC